MTKLKPTRPPSKSVSKRAEGSRGASSHPDKSAGIEDALRLSRILYEKCEMEEAERLLAEALRLSRAAGDLMGTMESLAGLLRIAGEAMDVDAIARWDRELDALMQAQPKLIPPMAWYCKGAIARRSGDYRLSQRFFHRYLRAVRADKREVSYGQSRAENMAKGWAMLVVTLEDRGRLNRAQLLSETLLKRFENDPIHGIRGILYMNLARIASRRREFELALDWYHKAHALFMSEHNWYYYLHVLLEYGRIARAQRNFSQAYWYLDLVERSTGTPGLAALRKSVETERARLQEDAVDLLVDSRKCIIKTREGGQISLRKQYVLLGILEALSSAHNGSASGSSANSNDQGGLSKAEIIERVWSEQYRPAAHDNKLYYNINRLRKLIEPDMSRPRYLLNWREGYRLAPGLKVHWVKDSNLRGDAK